jgi:drug/metabolite transporter (DMT)-like permease
VESHQTEDTLSLTPFVVAIVLSSTFMHAGWNLLARYGRSEGVFYLRLLIVTSVVGFIPAVLSELTTRSMPPLAWLCVLGSGTAAAAYLFFMARAFQSLDFSTVYPVVRALPVVLVAFADVARGRYLTPFGWVGVLLVASGCLLVPLSSIKDISLKNYLNINSLWMVFAALGTVGYTMLDKVAAEVVQPGPWTAVRYGYFYFFISLFPYWAMMRASRTSQVGRGLVSWKLASLGALFQFGAYGLILWAYQLTPYASYVVAFRQFSIVLGSAAAFLIYHEQGVRIRLTGALLITGGLVMIAVLGW